MEASGHPTATITLRYIHVSNPCKFVHLKLIHGYMSVTSQYSWKKGSFMPVRGGTLFYQSEFPLCIPAPHDKFVLMHPDLSDNCHKSQQTGASASLLWPRSSGNKVTDLLEEHTLWPGRLRLVFLTPSEQHQIQTAVTKPLLPSPVTLLVGTKFNFSSCLQPCSVKRLLELSVFLGHFYCSMFVLPPAILLCYLAKCQRNKKQMFQTGDTREGISLSSAMRRKLSDSTLPVIGKVWSPERTGQ